MCGTAGGEILFRKYNSDIAAQLKELGVEI